MTLVHAWSFHGRSHSQKHCTETSDFHSFLRQTRRLPSPECQPQSALAARSVASAVRWTVPLNGKVGPYFQDSIACLVRDPGIASFSSNLMPFGSVTFASFALLNAGEIRASVTVAPPVRSRVTVASASSA